MPTRNVIFAEDQIYHIFNRGVARQPIFSSVKDYQRFIELLGYYRFQEVPLSYSHLKKLTKEDKEKLLFELKEKGIKQIEIYAFCLMPNHFHLLIRQNTTNGITSFMKNLQNGYAKYYNIRHERAGPMFQSMFKAVRIESDEQLLHISRYIHLNPVTAYLISKDKITTYPWFSLPNYLDRKAFDFIKHEFILNFFKDTKAYEEFVLDQADYQRALNEIKHLTLE